MNYSFAGYCGKIGRVVNRFLFSLIPGAKVWHRQVVGVRCQTTEVRRQRTEVRRQRSEDRRQRTEVRGQKTDDRGQKTDYG